ncbi:hypothetical protein [Nannocystis pusilla]|uniref:hypothetical protein n=1 Tax=Nannocystis pusilla TaxID=889268 RepID=UPI003B7F6EBA
MLEGLRPPGNVDETRRFLDRCVAALRAFAVATVELQELMHRQGGELGVRIEGEDNPLLIAESEGDLLRYLLDWRATREERAHLLAEVFAAAMAHLRGALRGTVGGGQKVGETLSPREIERSVTAAWPTRAGRCGAASRSATSRCSATATRAWASCSAARPGERSARSWRARASACNRVRTPRRTKMRRSMMTMFAGTALLLAAGACKPKERDMPICPSMVAAERASEADTQTLPVDVWYSVLVRNFNRMAMEPPDEPRECSGRPIEVTWPDNLKEDPRATARPLDKRRLGDGDVTFTQGEDGALLVWARIQDLGNGDALGPVALVRWVERGLEVRGIGSVQAPPSGPACAWSRSARTRRCWWSRARPVPRSRVPASARARPSCCRWSSSASSARR